jgi:hypothetical protein
MRAERHAVRVSFCLRGCLAGYNDLQTHSGKFDVRARGMSWLRLFVFFCALGSSGAHVAAEWWCCEGWKD